jgi:hypothetical protein
MLELELQIILIEKYNLDDKCTALTHAVSPLTSIFADHIQDINYFKKIMIAIGIIPSYNQLRSL